MRIAHITATFPPRWTGTGMVCYYNARELARLGHDVHVYTAACPGAPAAETLEGIHVHRLRPLLQIGNAPLLPGLLSLQGFDLLHLHYPFISGAEMVRLAAAWRKIPYVMTHHNDLIGNAERRYIFTAYNFLSARWVANGASKWICVTREHALSSRLARYYSERPDDLLEIPNGVDIEAFHPEKNSNTIRQSYGVREDDFVVLFVGVLARTHHYRRVDVLLHALHRLNHPSVHLLLAGDGDQKSEYQQLAGSLGLKDRVHLLGRVDHKTLPQVYSAADVLVLPSTIQESFGMVLIESLACGTPVIASNLPGVRTVVAPGVDGYLVEPGDPAALAAALERLLALPPAQRRRMGAAGRRKVETRYAWEHIGQRLETLYSQVIAEGLKRAAPGEARPL